MQKFATHFQMVVNLQKGYTIVDWDSTSAGLYLSTKEFVNSFKTRLAASGTREELEDWVREFSR